MRTAKTLIRLGAQPHCWFCHEAAQMLVTTVWQTHVFVVITIHDRTSMSVESGLICTCTRNNGTENIRHKCTDHLYIQISWSIYNRAAARQTITMTGAPSEVPDQSGHPPSLVRVFAVRSVGNYGPKVSSCGQGRLWSDWADAQIDLSLRWAHRSFCLFCHASS